MNPQETKLKNDGVRYRLMRESLNLSRDGLADILGISTQSIWNRETGKHRISQEHWLAIQSVSIRMSIAKSDKVMTMPTLDIKKLDAKAV